uniref:Glutamyl-tRNA synthetase 2, mitochondrial n=1 Tax=Cynoglossus semilaevis TaxID=244447 RepID=A0A3P8X0S4_CYNSE
MWWLRFCRVGKSTLDTVVRRGCSTDQGEVRVRFAPSPTGFLHLGGLRTALYNYIFAKKYGGVFILRLEDTDQSRLVPGAAESIEDMLEWTGIPPDESPRRGGPVGPYLQSHRLELYRRTAQQLVEGGHAYYCFCSLQRLELLKKEICYMWSMTLCRYDNRCRHLHPDQVQEKMAKGEAHVIRFRLKEGVEPFEDMIFGWNRHDVAQVRLVGPSELTALGTPLLNKDGNKLSKRQGDIFIHSFQKDTILPDTLLDITTHCGSGFNSNRIGRRLDELISEFNPSNITTHSALIDLEKLPEFNRIHLLRCIEDTDQCMLLIKDLQERIRQTFTTEIQNEDVLNQDYIRRVLHLRKGHISSLKELVSPNYSYLWVRPSVTSQQVAAITAEAQHIATAVLKYVGTFLASCTQPCSSLPPHGPSVAEMMASLGPAEVSHRFQKLLQL